MLRKGKIAVIGDEETILIFKAIGMDIFAVKSVEEAEKIIRKVAREYGVIYITENYAKELEYFIQRYVAQTYPIITAIPSSQGSTGYAQKLLNEKVEKAIGIKVITEK